MSNLARRMWLGLRVHADAFGQNPFAYLQAVGWRFRGLKVRSRNRIAPLAGGSPHAYSLWMARQHGSAPASIAGATAEIADIIAIVDCRNGIDPTMTLAPLAIANADVRTVLIGGSPRNGFTRIDGPRALGSLLQPGGSWICPVMAGDLIDPAAFDMYAAAIKAAPLSGVIYADDDLIEGGRVRHHPHFKPQWNPDLFASHDYLTGSSMIFVTPEAASRLPETDWAKTLLDRALELGATPVHVPKVLHHRRSRPAPNIPSLPEGPIRDAPLVSVIIPTRNQSQLLRTCIEGVEQVDYPRIELVVVDNGSDDPEALEFLGQLEGRGHKVPRCPGPFNYSALNNQAVRHASGSMLCFLNNDVEMVDRNWLSLLVRQALRPEIGAAGAMLLYPDRTIQHAGVYLGIGGGAGHGHRYQPEEEFGYFGRAQLPQLVSAVTAACMVVEREKFLAVGGFDEVDFPVAFNDVDLCLKLNSDGWQSFYEPRARLIHHESKSRGSDSAKGNRDRFAGELAALKAKWRTDRQCDPFHHPELSPFSEQFVVAV